jgi:hypothetical protein
MDDELLDSTRALSELRGLRVSDVERSEIGERGG